MRGCVLVQGEIRPKFLDDFETAPDVIDRGIPSLPVQVLLHVFREQDGSPGWRDEPEVEHGYLVIDLFYPPREQGFLAFVDFEGPVVGPSVDHAFVVVDPAAKVGAHLISVLPNTRS